MELRQLEAFVEAAQRGSITQAARVLFLAQPSLTQRIRQLEQELGQQLLIRSGRGVRLTAAGRLFLPRAEAALAALRFGAEEVRSLREVTGGWLTVGVTPDIALYVLPVPLSRFTRAHPDVTVSLDTGHSLPMAALVLSGRAELALVTRAVRQSGLEEICLYEERLLPVAAPDHPAAMQPRLTLADLAAAGMVAYRPDSSLRDLILEFFDTAGVAPRVVVRAHNTEAARRLVLAGVGVGLLPELSVRDDLATERLLLLPLEKAKLPVRGVWALRHEEAQPSAAARAFLDMVIEHGLPRRPRTRRPRA